MKQFLALLKARNIEYYRDKGSLAWAFIFPLLIIIGCAMAFSTPDTSVFRIGLLTEQDQLPAITEQLSQQGLALQRDYIKLIPFSADDADRARQRVQHHQLDLLIDPQQNRYWSNPESSSSIAARELLAAHSPLQEQQLKGRAVRYVDWVIPGVLGMNLMFGSLFGVGYVIVRYRQNGVLKRLQATPISAGQFLAAQLSSRLLIVVLVNGSIFIGCKLLLDLIVLGRYLDLLLITLLGALSMISLGLLAACRTANEELAGGLLNVATWPMLFLSEVWFSLDDAPHWMQMLAELMPLTHIVKASRAVMIEGATLADIGYHLLWLAALSAICLTLAVTFFKWHRNG